MLQIDLNASNCRLIPCNQMPPPSSELPPAQNAAARAGCVAGHVLQAEQQLPHETRACEHAHTRRHRRRVGGARSGDGLWRAVAAAATAGRPPCEAAAYDDVRQRRAVWWRRQRWRGPRRRAECWRRRSGRQRCGAARGAAPAGGDAGAARPHGPGVDSAGVRLGQPPSTFLSPPSRRPSFPPSTFLSPPSRKPSIPLHLPPPPPSHLAGLSQPLHTMIQNIRRRSPPWHASYGSYRACVVRFIQISRHTVHTDTV
eukprot:298473-Chlamydomonas_euryale.AAC.3